jgi:hypothetical protein
MTWVELAQELGLHHGSASGVLSNLHKVGLLARLQETRNKCQVYVDPNYVLGRQTAPYRPNVSARLLVDILHEIEHDLNNDDIYLARQRIRKTLETFNMESQ